jgi:uncharacterized membrane protein
VAVNASLIAVFAHIHLQDIDPTPVKGLIV